MATTTRGSIAHKRAGALKQFMADYCWEGDRNNNILHEESALAFLYRVAATTPVPPETPKNKSKFSSSFFFPTSFKCKQTRFCVIFTTKTWRSVGPLFIK